MAQYQLHAFSSGPYKFQSYCPGMELTLVRNDQWDQSTDDVDPQWAIEYEVYVNGTLSPLAVDTGVGRSFVYGTVNGLNSFVVKAVDRTGNTSAPSNSATAELWLC